MVAVQHSSSSSSSSPARASSAATSSSITDTLRVGARGAQVRTLQQQLNEHGARLDVDGTFGPQTEAAVRGFQRSHGLDVDGVVGPLTRAKLQGPPRSHDGGDVLLHVGSRGPDVLAAEKRLHALGYDTGAVDGRYDAQTVRAVRAFKADEKMADRTGRLGAAGQQRLQQVSSSWQHAPERTRVTNHVDAHRRAIAHVDDAIASVRPDGTTGLRAGDQGADVKTVQRHLRAAGFSVGVLDGRYDERTAGAVRTFQRHSGLPTTGQVDAPTWRALQRSELLASSSTSPPQSIGERGAAVRHTEELLARAGYEPGHVDGRFDGGTLRALHAFERDHHLARTNDVGRTTLHALERAARAGSVVRPIAAPLTRTSEFGVRDAEGAPANSGARFHAGKDWFAPGGSTVRAPVDGTIVEARASRGDTGQVFGGTVKVQDRDGKVWVFRHVDPRHVQVGQHVEAGQPIANVTSWRDGPSHAHIELWKTFAGGYDFENMLDPMTVLQRFL